MSWIVQSLWNDRERIKHSTRKEVVTVYEFYPGSGTDEPVNDDTASYDDPCIESEEFNDLLIVEKAVDELKELGLLSPSDLDVLNDNRDSFRTRNQKYVFDKRFSYVCERIAYYLGGYFTDDGYISYLTKKHKLSPKQVETVRAYMKSQFKNKTLSKGYRIENNHEETRFVTAEV